MAKKLKQKIMKMIVPAENKSSFLKQLDSFGINSQPFFINVSGIYDYINWKYNK